MPKFYSDKNVTVSLVLTRSYPTNQEIVDNHGIFFNFSAKLVISTKQEEIAAFAMNDLSLRQTRDGKFFMGSTGRPNTYKDRDTGETVRNGMIWALGLFPGALDNPDVQKMSDKFIEELVDECTEFAVRAQARAAEPKNAFKVPDQLKGLIKPAPIREKKEQGKSPI